jgi:hypothetical protein
MLSPEIDVHVSQLVDLDLTLHGILVHADFVED